MRSHVSSSADCLAISQSGFALQRLVNFPQAGLQAIATRFGFHRCHVDRKKTVHIFHPVLAIELKPEEVLVGLVPQQRGLPVREQGMHLGHQHSRPVVSAAGFYHAHKLARTDLVTNGGGLLESAVCAATRPEDILFCKLSGQVESGLLLFVGGALVVGSLSLPSRMPQGGRQTVFQTVRAISVGAKVFNIIAKTILSNI